MHEHGNIPALPQPPEHHCLQLLEGHSPSAPQHRAASPGCHPHSPVLDTECFVHLAAKQNKTGFLRFPTQLPCLALFPVLVFVHILVLFYGRTPRPIPTCSPRVCQAGSQASEQQELRWEQTRSPNKIQRKYSPLQHRGGMHPNSKHRQQLKCLENIRDMVMKWKITILAGISTGSPVHEQAM